MNKPNTFTKKIDIKLEKKLREDLLTQGFEFFEVPYALFGAKKNNIICILYRSGSLVVQGKDKDEFIEFYLEPEILKDFAYTHPESKINTHSRIGVDEAGKGDFFGPLCVAAFYADEPIIKKLISLKIQDSKKIQDTSIIKLAKELKKFPHHIISIFPKKYNELHKKFNNLNYLLAWGHVTAIENLVQKTNCENIIIDQFASEHVIESFIKQKKLDHLHVKQRHRAEEDIVVAAASILARDAFINGLERLEKHFNVTLPKGASQKVIQAGINIIKEHGSDIMDEIAKTHFKTKDKILQNIDND